MLNRYIVLEKLNNINNNIDNNILNYLNNNKIIQHSEKELSNYIRNINMLNNKNNYNYNYNYTN